MVFAGLAAGMLLPAMNVTLVVTALPAMVEELGGFSQMSWILTSYMLAAAVGVPLLGKVSDLVGRKPLFEASIVIFVVGSALSGLAQSIGQLIAFRVVQGIGGGAVMALAQTTIADVVAPRQRGRYQGYLGAVMGVASIIGPLLGGLFVDHLTWRWAFFVNVPLGLVALAVTRRHVPLSGQRRGVDIDYAGAGLLSAALVALLLTMVWGGQTFAWTSPAIVALGAVSVLGFVALVPVERRAAEPMVPLELFADRTFRVSAAISFLLGVTLFGTVLFIPLFLQTVTRVSATSAGLLLLPLLVGMVTTSTVSGRLITRHGRYKIYPITGSVLSVPALALLGSMDASTGLGEVAGYMFFTGFAMGLVFQVVVLAVQNSVDARHLGIATSATQLARMVGSTIGVALFGVILNHRLAGNVAGTLAPLPPGVDLQALVDQPTLVVELPARLQRVFRSGLADAITHTFTLAAPLAATTALFSFRLVEQPLHDEPRALVAADPGPSQARASTGRG